MEGMREKILTFIEKNSRIDLKELAIVLGVDEVTVANELEAMEAENIICGYHTLIDWDKTGIEKVTALIEVRVTPQRGMGFDKVAERIYNYPDVTFLTICCIQYYSRILYKFTKNVYLKILIQLFMDSTLPTNHFFAFYASHI